MNVAVKSTIIIPLSDTCRIAKTYAGDDPIWNLPEEKRVRKALADVQRELLKYTDENVQIPMTVRG